MAGKLFVLGAGLAVALLAFSIAGTGHSVKRSEAATASWNVVLTGSQEVPPAVDGGFGSAIVTYDNVTRQMTITLNAVSTSGPITAGHIHKGASGVAGPVIIPFNSLPPNSGVVGIAFGVTLSAQDATDLMAGQLYLNVHSTGFPGGFARGQLIVPANAFPAAPAPTTAAAAPAATTAAPAASLAAPRTGDAGLVNDGTNAWMTYLTLLVLAAVGGVGLLATKRR